MAPMASHPCPWVRDTIIHHHPSKPRKARWGPRPIKKGHTCQAGPTWITSQVGEEERWQEDILLAQHCATSLGPDLTRVFVFYLIFNFKDLMTRLCLYISRAGRWLAGQNIIGRCSATTASPTRYLCADRQTPARSLSAHSSLHASLPIGKCFFGHSCRVLLESSKSILFLYN